MPLWLLWMFMALWPGLCAWAEDADVLHPSQAFRPTIQALDAKTVEVRFQIAPGHYLDRDRVVFSTRPPSATLGAAVLPQAVRKPAPHGGWMNALTDRAIFLLPVHAHPTASTLRLHITYQGCAEAGLCHPPQERILTIALPDADAPSLWLGGRWHLDDFGWPEVAGGLLAVLCIGGGGWVWLHKQRRPQRD